MKRYPDLFGRCRNGIRSMLLPAVVLGAAIGIGGHSGGAQQASVAPEWQALVVPYL